MSFETGEESCHAFGDPKDDNQHDLHDSDDEEPEPNWDMDLGSPTFSYKVYL
jgi:hypothetical protein